jgi:hypothetical protein
MLQRFLILEKRKRRRFERLNDSFCPPFLILIRAVDPEAEDSRREDELFKVAITE